MESEHNVDSDSLVAVYPRLVANLRHVRSWVTHHLSLVVLILASTAYSVCWSAALLARYEVLNMPVADLGTASQRIWIIPHLTPLSGLEQLLTQGGTYYLLPLAFFPSQPFLLVFQSVILGFAALPLYFIAKHHLGDGIFSIAVPFAYLFYFPLAGINWFAFHFQSMFIPLFILGYYMYLRGFKKTFVLLMLLGGLVKFPYSVYPALFAITELVILFQRSKPHATIYTHLRRNSSLVVLAIVSAALAGGGAAVILLQYNGGLLPFVHATSSGPSGPPYLDTLYPKFETFLLLLGPLLFLPLFSKRWWPLYLPFAGLVLYTTNQQYWLPNLFQHQYTSAIIPFLFLGLIDVVAEILAKGRPLGVVDSDLRRSIASVQRRTGMTRRLITVAITSTLVFVVFFQPYGPLNQYGPAPYDLASQTSGDSSQYQRLMAEVSLIPRSNPYVLIQNNLPELLPRNLAYFDTPLIVGTGPFAHNLTLSEVATNSFPKDNNGRLLNVSIDYALGDAYNGFFYSGNPASATMLEFMQKMYQSGYYGILAEDGGFVLLERGYGSSPKLFVPYSRTAPATSIHPNATSSVCSQSECSYQNVSHTSMFKDLAGSQFLPPGVYNVTLFMRPSILEANDSMTFSAVLRAGNYYGSIYKVQPYNLTASNFTGNSTSVTIQIAITQFHSYVYFESYINTWPGTVLLKGLRITQVSAY